jgi:hypothetical protein
VGEKARADGVRVSPAAIAVVFGASIIGAAIGGTIEMLASRMPRSFDPPVRGVTIRLRVRTSAAGAIVGLLVPLGAWAIAPSVAGAAAAAVVGWLLLGIAIFDERCLQVPHALSAAGVSSGLALGWWDGGWTGLGGRAFAAAALAAGVWGASRIAGAIYGRAAIGAGDFGVLAFVGALCGLVVGLDVVLVAGVAALALLSPVRNQVGSFIPGTLLLASVGLAAYGGVAGPAVAALGLVLLRPALAARAREAPAAAPFAACLALGVVVVILACAVPGLHGRSPLGSDGVLRHLLSHNR